MHSFQRVGSALLSTLLAASAMALPAVAGTLSVVSHTPARNSSTALPGTSIAVTFNLPLNTATVTATSFRAYGRWSGPASGAFAFSNANQTVTLTPNRPFSAGETVFVNLANTLQAADGSPLRSAGYAFLFGIRVLGGSAEMVEIDQLSVQTTASATRLYGGFAADFDHDGWLDLAGVNEVSHDLRILFNRDDGSGLFNPVHLPVTPIGVEASPNEPGDFDNDGEVDAAIVNASDGTVSVVLGHGDGSFDPQQVLTVGSGPHGIAVLDVDGDGDWDVVTGGYNSNNMTLYRNNGSGVFGSSSSFDAGGNGEWPVAAGDMNNDGITDLVVGTANDAKVHVLTGNGNGTFTHASSAASGGFTWMLALGDVNGDGNLDVSVANGGDSNGGILLGNGAGGLAAAVTYAIGGSAVATDLGDLDGDGDLDWVLSSFGAARWYFKRNQGNGTFSDLGEIAAPQSGSCAVLFDADNDGDLDAALFDELADTIQVIRNLGGNPVFADGFETGNTSAWAAQLP